MPIVKSRNLVHKERLAARSIVCDTNIEAGANLKRLEEDHAIRLLTQLFKNEQRKLIKIRLGKGGFQVPWKELSCCKCLSLLIKRGLCNGNDVSGSSPNALFVWCGGNKT
jgi:hypothetical protein